VKRAALASRHPVHVTVRVVRGLPNLRALKLFRVVRRALGAGAVRDGFRLVHYSVQSNHLHLIVEAKDTASLSAGMKGLQVRIARRLNRRLGRSGKVFTRRFHARALKTPTEVRNALVYVLNNARRHAAQRGRELARDFLDPCSSAASFDGWKDATAPPPEPPATTGTRRPHTWLLRKGWRYRGLLRITQLPTTA
jgi:REP element-mobilizing transposase RayT